MLREHFFSTKTCVLYLCVFLTSLLTKEIRGNDDTSINSGVTDSGSIRQGSSYRRETVNNSSSREQVNPMPLIRPLNGSEVEVLMQEANNMFVSNTSFDDIVSDNETHQLIMQYRERKRQVRLMTIQQEILQKLGFDKEFNVSSRMSEEQRMNLVSSYHQMAEMRDMNDTDMDELAN